MVVTLEHLWVFLDLRYELVDHLLLMLWGGGLLLILLFLKVLFWLILLP